MNDFQPYQIDSGASSVVLRISPDRVSKYAKPQYVDFIRHERNVLKRIGSHPLVVSTFESPNDSEVLLEYHEGGNLRQYLHSGQAVPLQQWAQQIAEALVFIHSSGVIHCDLNPRNILLGPTGILLCDFGTSALEGRRQPGAGAEIRFCAWDKTISAQNDIFAFGSLLYELSTVKHLMQNEATRRCLSCTARRHSPR